MIEVLFQQQNKWAVGPPASPLPPLLAIAKQTGFTEESFNACLQGQEGARRHQMVVRPGQALGVRRHPRSSSMASSTPARLTIEQIEKAMAPFLKS